MNLYIFILMQRYNLLSKSPNLWRIILWLTTMIFFFQSLDFFLPLSNYLLRFCHLLLQLPASIFDRLNLIILSQIDTTFLIPCASLGHNQQKYPISITC